MRSQMASTLARGSCWVSPMSKARSQRRQPLIVGEARAGNVADDLVGDGGEALPLRAASRGVVPGHALDALARRCAAHGEGAVLGDGPGERPGAGEHLAPSGRPPGHGDDAQPGFGGAHERVIRRRHQRSGVRERVVDVAEDAAQRPRERSQLRYDFMRRAKLSELVADAREEVEARSRQRIISIVGVRS